MRKSMLISGSVLCLFILVSLSYQPMLAVEQIEYEEITVNICGFNRLESQRISLSKEDGERINVIFDELENELSQVETREETIIIYNGAIGELYSLGIFGDIDLDELQNMITLNTLLKPYSITGNTTHTNFIAPGYRFHNIIFNICNILYDIELPLKLIKMFFGYLQLFLAILVWGYGYEYIMLLSKHINGALHIGKKSIPTWEGRIHYYPANGWIEVQDKTGETNNYSGEMYGDLTKPTAFIGGFFAVQYYVGIEGFNGISIKRNDCLYYMGSASKVGVTYEKP